MKHVLNIAVILLLISCGGSMQDSIKIGSILALSGEHSSFGIKQRQAFELAVAEINEEGGVHGIPIEIEYADSSLDPDKALQEYKRLKASGTDVIIGISGSGAARRVAPWASQDKIPLLSSLDTSPRLTTEGGEYFFRNIASDEEAFNRLAAWSIEQGTGREALIYNSEDGWAQGCKESVESNLGGRQLETPPIAVLGSTTDFIGPIMTLRSAAGLQAVFVCLYGRQGGLLLSQAMQAGLDLSFYSADGFSQTEFIENARESARNAFYVMPAELKSEEYQRFTTAYSETYGESPDGIAAKSYDLMHLLATTLNSLSAEQLTGEAIRNALLGAEYVGVTGKNSFDEKGDLEGADFSRFTYSEELEPIQISK